MRTAKYLQVLEKVVNSETVCLTVGDLCPLSLIVSKLGARKVYASEPNVHCRRVLESWVKQNHLEEKIQIFDGDFSTLQLESKVILKKYSVFK